jgi:amino acid transporter
LTSIAGGSITASAYFDSLSGSLISNFTEGFLHANWDFGPLFSDHLDICAISVVLVVSFVSLLNVKQTTSLNNLLAVLNIILLSIISISGFLLGDFANLTGVPYDGGFTGILRGCSLVI